MSPRPLPKLHVPAHLSERMALIGVFSSVASYLSDWLGDDPSDEQRQDWPGPPFVPQTVVDASAALARELATATVAVGSDKVAPLIFADLQTAADALVGAFDRWRRDWWAQWAAARMAADFGPQLQQLYLEGAHLEANHSYFARLVAAWLGEAPDSPDDDALLGDGLPQYLRNAFAAFLRARCSFAAFISGHIFDGWPPWRQNRVDELLDRVTAADKALVIALNRWRTELLVRCALAVGRDPASKN